MEIPQKTHADIQFEEMLKKMNILQTKPDEQPLYPSTELHADQRIGYINKIKEENE
jgi:hypothetical protein